MKRLIVLLIISGLFIIGCSKSEDEDSNPITSNDGDGLTVDDGDSGNSDDHEDDSDYIWSEADIIDISLNGSSISSSSQTLQISGSTVTISSAGTYRFKGTLTNGQIIVNTQDANIVRLLLNGTEITNTSSSPIYIRNADKVLIATINSTSNTLTDGSTYTLRNNGEDEPNAAIFSMADLTLYGTGSLIINGNYNDGIASKDGLIIKSGTITVDAKDDGIRGKDYVVMKDGNLTIISGGDGIKSDNDVDASRGYIKIAKGNINITAGQDGIGAQTDVLISDGTFSIISGGGSNYSVSSGSSSKGIKAPVEMIIDNGDFIINSADDALHSNVSLTINNGSFEISTHDDGIHADSTIEINNGTINISKCYEGIESTIIVINDGKIKVSASDDGLNVAGGNDGSGWPGPPGGYSSSGNYYSYINGGYIAIYAVGDGVDANGSIVMTGGKVIVHGPTADNNSAIDYDGSYKMSGGFIIAAGSAGMAQAPGSSSTQYSLLVNFTSTFSAGTLFNLQSTDGTEIVTFKPAKNYRSVAFCSPDLKNNTSYNIYKSGSTTGTEENGLYEGGKYTPGTLYTGFTISGIVTKIGGR